VGPWCERRSARFHKLASFHSDLWAWEMARKQGGCVVMVTPELDKYHKAMTAKYALAARYPWLPVAHDPPEPK
jgi:hypothetical protein